ncbi:MAG: hypothetical protein AB1488_00845 [Nitrospirota bacterium]
MKETLFHIEDEDRLDIAIIKSADLTINGIKEVLRSYYESESKRERYHKRV